MRTVKSKLNVVTLVFVGALLMVTFSLSVSGIAAEEQVTLKVILPANPEGEVIKQCIPKFEEETGIKVDLTDVAVEQLDTKITVELYTGAKTADVIGGPYDWMPKYSKYLLPLDEYLTDQDREDFLPAALGAMTIDDKILGLPFAWTCMILFYRTDLFEEKNLQVPKTWEEHLAVAEALTQKDAGIWGTIVTAKNTEEPVGMLLNYIYQNGGDVIDDNNNITLNSPEAIEALQFMYDLVYKFKVAPPGASNYWCIDTLNLFNGGKLATAPNWSFMYGIANSDDTGLKGKIGMSLLPIKKRQAVSLGGWSLYAPNYTEHPKEAFEFIHFMTNTWAQSEMAIRGSNTPSRKSTMADYPEIKANPLFVVMFDALSYSIPRTKYPHYRELQVILSEALSGCLAGTITPEEALNKAASEYEKVINEPYEL